MAEGITPGLLLLVCCVWLAGVLIIGKLLPAWIVVLVSLVKVLIPCIYFACYYSGAWNLVDDLFELNSGAALLHAGYTPLSAITQSTGIAALISTAGGPHFLYNWWNLLSQYLFGEHYYAPVFMNIVLTYVGGLYLFRMALFLGFSRTYSRYLLLFFLLHWDVVAWSSFMNLKDIMVTTLTLMSFYFILRLCKRYTLTDLA